MQYTKELFDKSIAILVASYLDDTLVNNNCYACAVGNMIAAGMGYKFKQCHESRRKIKWAHIPGESYFEYDKSDAMDWMDVICEGHKPNQKVEKEINSTGYLPSDLFKIEKAFESYRYGEDSMFNGLMAVVDVLCEIHGMNETEKQESKALFVKA